MKRSTRFLALFAAVVLAGSVLTGCSGGSSDNNQSEQTQNNNAENNSSKEPVYGGEISVGIAQDLDDSLDPHYMVAAGTKEVLFNIFEGLVKPTPDGELIPAVAESYEVDGATYTFKLRDGIKFHNGEAVTVDDIVYSISRCADTSEGAPLVSAFSAITAIEAVDDKTVKITINEPNGDFLAYLTTAIIPKDYDDQASNPVGTGPFKFVSRSPQENFIMEKFEDYWGEPAYLDKVTYKILDSAEAIVMSLRSGSVDLVAHLTSSQAKELGDSYNILEGTMNLVQAVYLNNAVKPFDDPKVRQALCYAINVDDILALTADGHGAPIGSSMYPSFKKYFMPELTDYYTYDPEKAKELLAEAGYPDGFDMVITVPSNYQPHIDTAEVVVEQFRAIGVNATIETVEWSSWLSDVYKGRDFEATVVGVDASAMTARALLERFTSDASGNFINFSDAEYDRIFAEVAVETDSEKQVELYKQLETILTEKAANVYIQDLADLVAINPSLDGLNFYPIYVLDLSTVHYVK